LRKGEKGFYLLELLVAILLFAIVITAVLQSIIVSNNWLHNLCNRTSAFALAQEKMEEVLSGSYIQIIPENYPIDHPVITFANPEFPDNDLVGTREVTIIPFESYKEVAVNISWQEKGREESESIYSLVSVR